MSIVYYLRHAESQERGKTRRWQGAGSNALLTGIGREQAQLLATYFQDKGSRFIFTSPLDRAIATAAPIGISTGCVPHVLEELQERNLGIFDSHTTADIERDFPQEYRMFLLEPDSDILQGETAASLEYRLDKLHQQVLAQRQDGLVVSHYHVLGNLLRRILCLPAFIPTRNACVSAIAFEKSSHRVLFLDEDVSGCYQGKTI